MDSLPQIIANEQGSSAVSARDLHSFLEIRSKFIDWIKNRIVNYGFLEDTDYMTVSKNLESGGREIDYAITLDMAKQLSMVEKNDKGKQARKYFINCERAALELAKQPAPALPAPPPSQTEQMMLTLMQQQAQLMSGQQLMLEQLRADVESIKAGGRPASRNPRPSVVRHTPALPMQQPVPSLRKQFTDKVSEYCARYDVYFDVAYNHMYNRLYKDFNFNVNHYRVGNEKPLDTVERYGKLMWLISIVDSELAYSE